MTGLPPVGLSGSVPDSRREGADSSGPRASWGLLPEVAGRARYSPGSNPVEWATDAGESAEYLYSGPGPACEGSLPP
ncbi:hypothetical protein SNL152K_6877 [Streptomyces sp. NL15-2K]|nr:hypothetical protein SNL152K_6877 [Streptomyces sp. NL15-2K]